MSDLTLFFYKISSVDTPKQANIMKITIIVSGDGSGATNRESRPW